MKKLFTLFIFVTFLSNSIYPQLEDRIKQLTPSEAAKYATPLSTAMGTYFNSGAYYTADVPTTFGFRFSIIGMYIFVPDDQLKFTPTIEGITNPEQTATAFGDEGGIYLAPNGYIVYPPGINVSSFPAGIPQLGFSMLNTELMVRFFPKVKIEQVEAQFWGLGIKHSFGKYIPGLPVDLAAQILINNFSIEHTNVKIDSKNFAFNVHASKSFNLLTVYGGLQYENTSTDLEYLLSDPDNKFPEFGNNQRVSTTADGDNNFRFNFGAAIKLAFLVINADYNFGSQNVLSGGVSLEI